MKEINLTPLKNELDDEELQSYDMGEIVKVPQGVGIIAAMVDNNFKFPVGSSSDSVNKVQESDNKPTMKKIKASKTNPVYIVALQKGGSVAVSPNEISGQASLKGSDGKSIKSWKDVGKQANTAQLSEIYEYADGDPHSMAVLEEAKAKMIRERQAADLADYIEEEDKSLEELGEMSAEELVNIPGVRDPGIGFSSMPNGWTRKSVLQAWATLGGMWRTCFARMIIHFGPYMAKRWCAALKDEVLGTTMWRNKF